MDALRFYVGARTGVGQIMGNATVGMATLRRDGFASVEASSGQASSGGVLETRSVVFSGKHFFVNMATKPGGKGSVSVAALDSSGAPIAPFTHQNCASVTKDSVRQAVTWKQRPQVLNVACAVELRRPRNLQGVRRQILLATAVGPNLRRGVTFGPVLDCPFCMFERFNGLDPHGAQFISVMMHGMAVPS